MNRIPSLVLLIVAAVILPARAADSTGESDRSYLINDAVERQLRTVDSVIADGPFSATWSSLEKYQIPEWYKDAKFGIFIHWGVYSVPAFGSEWYPRNMYTQGSPEFRHHIATYGPQNRFGYKDFIPKFTAKDFNADGWADLFDKAGAKFVVPVAEHHDGFPMYDTAMSNWSAAKMGPKRDIVGELSVAVRKKGLIFGVSSHRAEHWFFYSGGRKFDSDVNDPKYAGLYGPAEPAAPNGVKGPQPDQAYLDNWLARSTELVDKYHPQIVWFDWYIGQPVFKTDLRKFGAFYYNRAAQWHEGVAINYKFNAYPEHAAVLDIERGELSGIRPLLWQTDTSIMKNSWGYVSRPQYKTAEEILGDLIDITSKNGVLLLNIGPKSDGTIPVEQQRILLKIGDWLRVNGQAIYGTRPFKVYGEGPTKAVEGSFNDTKRSAYTARDVRFTTHGGTLYAIIMARPDRTLTIHSLAESTGLVHGSVSDVTLLGSEQKPRWTQTAAGLDVEIPETAPDTSAAVLKIEGLTF